jgi:mannose-1-phosphate guanylyltransferase
MYAIVMSGGRGKRFWPLSSKSLPKQFMHFAGEGTLFQQTVYRLRHVMPKERIFTVTREAYKNIILEQIPDFPEENIIVEPMQKNTGPCIGLGTIHISMLDPDAITVVLPSDHYIEDADSFLRALTTGAKVAREGRNLVTLGVLPTRPHTGYGYIHAGKRLATIDGQPILKVDKFVEKPDRETAIKLLKEGSYYWNSGIFLWKVSTILAGFEQHLPVVYSNLMKLKQFIGTDLEEEAIARSFEPMPSISIDYGVIEKANNIVLIPVDMGWNDIGSWSALETICEKDQDGNICLGNDVFITDASNSTLMSTGTLVAIGIEDMIVVQRGDLVLVCHKDKEQYIQELVEEVEMTRSRSRSNLSDSLGS